MEQRDREGSVQNFALFAISVGVLLIFASLISITSIVVAFGYGILIHTLSDVRSNVLRIVLSFIIPFLGGAVLILAGRKMLEFEGDKMQKRITTTIRKKALLQKEKIINILLNKDERGVIDIIKKNPDGVLQSDLVIRTGYSKVKMHRILKGLENKGLIKRGRFGITNRVLIND